MAPSAHKGCPGNFLCHTLGINQATMTTCIGSWLPAKRCSTSPSDICILQSGCSWDQPSMSALWGSSGLPALTLAPPGVRSVTTHLLLQSGNKSVKARLLPNQRAHVWRQLSSTSSKNISINKLNNSRLIDISPLLLKWERGRGKGANWGKLKPPGLLKL
jgi:hypothetical protein